MKWPYTNTGSFSVLLPLRSEWVENNTGEPPIFAEVIFSWKRKNRSNCEWRKLSATFLIGKHRLLITSAKQRERERERESETTWKLPRSQQDNIKMYITERVGLLTSFIIGSGVESSTSKPGKVAIIWATIGSCITRLRGIYSNKTSVTLFGYLKIKQNCCITQIVRNGALTEIISKRPNIRLVTSSSSPSSYSLQGVRPRDLFWSHQQPRNLLRGRPWLRFPQSWHFIIKPLALELNIYSLAHHLCTMWIFYEPRRVTLGNARHFVERNKWRWVKSKKIIK